MYEPSAQFVHAHFPYISVVKISTAFADGRYSAFLGTLCLASATPSGLGSNCLNSSHFETSALLYLRVGTTLPVRLGILLSLLASPQVSRYTRATTIVLLLFWVILHSDVRQTCGTSLITTYCPVQYCSCPSPFQVQCVLQIMCHQALGTTASTHVIHTCMYSSA